MIDVEEQILAWKTELEAERATLLQQQASGEFTEVDAGRLLNIESMLEQVDINQHLSMW